MWVAQKLHFHVGGILVMWLIGCTGTLSVAQSPQRPPASRHTSERARTIHLCMDQERLSRPCLQHEIARTSPKPGITVGILREAFSRNHACLLDCWQTRKVVLSDPHVKQAGMRLQSIEKETRDESIMVRAKAKAQLVRVATCH